MTDDKVLCVFYTFSDKLGGSWDYDAFPRGWRRTGAGRTYSIYLSSVTLEERKSVKKYEREEQFN